jgi:hypothetical protein
MYRCPTIFAGFYNQLLADSTIDNRSIEQFAEHAIPADWIDSVESRRPNHMPFRHLAPSFVRSVNGNLLERELQGKLYLSRRPCGRQIAELLRPENGRVVSILRSAKREQEIGVVREIEELGAKFQIRPFRGVEELEY